MTGEGEKVRLYGHWSSPFCALVEMALKMKGVEYDYFSEDLNNKSPDLLKYNPVHKKIPVLVHDGKPIAESKVIIEYIDETWKSGPVILPVDPYAKAMARFWADLIFQKCMDPIWMATLTTDQKEFEKLAEVGRQGVAALEKQLETGQGKKFFGGESPGYVDIIACFIGLWLGAIQEASEKEVVKEGDEYYPLLSKWKEDFLNWNIAKETLPPRDKLVAVFRELFESFAGASKA